MGAWRCAIDPDSRWYRLVSTVKKIESEKVKELVWEVLYITGWWFQMPLYVHSCFGKSSNLMSIFFQLGLVQPPTFWEVPYQGFIKLPLLGGIKQYKCVVILRDFPYHNALLGLVYNTMTPFRQDADYCHVPGF